MEEVESAIDDREGEVERLQEIVKRQHLEAQTSAECSHCHEEGKLILC